VGAIYAITLSETVSDNWLPNKIMVNRGGSEETLFYGNEQGVDCPTSCEMYLELPKPIEPLPESDGDLDLNPDDEPLEPEDGANEITSDGYGGTPVMSAGPRTCNPDNTYWGCALTSVETNAMLELTCEQSIKGTPMDEQGDIVNY